MQLTFWMSIKYLSKQSHDFVLMITDRSKEARREGRKEGRREGRVMGAQFRSFVSIIMPVLPWLTEEETCSDDY
jgi:hypothetical protein